MNAKIVITKTENSPTLSSVDSPLIMHSLYLYWARRTSCYELTKQQPLVNLIRTTLHALGAVLSGTTAMELPGYDEPIGIPTEEAAILSLRIQQVIAEETGITKVTDPLGGSYYVEWLTNKMEEGVNKYIATIDEMGGALEAIRRGYIQREIRRSAYDYQIAVDSSGNAYVTGNALSTNFPTVHPIQANHAGGMRDAFDEGEKSADFSGREFRISMQSPCNIWSKEVIFIHEV
jgi:methylmalonyl-CoA mutase cobalamin-binding domain/chain